MTAYLVTSITAHGLDWVADYLAHVPAIVQRHGGAYLAVSPGVPNAVERVEGTAPIPQAMAILSFPSAAAARTFLASPDYEPFKSARQAATDSSFFLFENDDGAPQFAGQAAL